MTELLRRYDGGLLIEDAGSLGSCVFVAFNWIEMILGSPNRRRRSRSGAAKGVGPHPLADVADQCPLPRRGSSEDADHRSGR